MKSTDSHHIFWYHKAYSKGWAKRLRDYWYCKIEIPRITLHRQIHYEVSYIPLPNAVNTKEALCQLEILRKYGCISRNDNIEKRLRVLMALFDCVEPDTYAALKAQYEVACKYLAAP